ncbi:MAG: DUF1573 domain-containing protein [Planctomycetota bacterium]|jgi:hypothetical protein
MLAKKQVPFITVSLILSTLFFLNIQIAFAAEDDTSTKIAGPVPKLQIQNKTIDFGQVYSDTIVTADIKFTNEGDAPLEIKKIKPSCGCMAGKLTQKIYQPGESGTINLSYKTKNKKGPSKGTVIISSNDLKQPNAKVALKADVIQLIQRTPSVLSFRNLDVGQSITKSIHVTTKKPLLIEAAVRLPEDENLKIEITPKQQNVTDKGADFNVTVTPSAIGRYTNGINLTSKKGLENPIVINSSLLAVVQGPVIASPQFIYFSVVKGKAKARTINLSSKDPNVPLVIEKINYDKELLDIKVNPAENDHTANLLVSFKPKTPSDIKSKTTNIKIEAKSGTESTTLLIPVKVHKRISRPRQTSPSKKTSTPISKPENPPPKKSPSDNK